MVTDPIRAQVASTSTTLDPHFFVDKLNEISDQLKFTAAVGRTYANPQDCKMFEYPTIFKSTTPFEDMEDCELFEDVTADFVSASHAKNPSGVTPELLENLSRIDNTTAKRTDKVTTQLSIKDANTSLSRKFGKNNRMLK